MKKAQIILLIILASLVFIDIMVILWFKFHLFSGQEWGWTGDAIGGIGGTVISVIAVVGVYLAYREQIAANRMLENKEDRNLILAQIKLLEEIDFSRRCDDLISHFTKPVSDKEVTASVFKVQYCISELEVTLDLILNYNGANRTILFVKFKNIYADKFLLTLIDLEVAEAWPIRKKYAADVESTIALMRKRSTQIRLRVSSVNF